MRVGARAFPAEMQPRKLCHVAAHKFGALRDCISVGLAIGKFTDPGLLDHALTFAASSLVPRLHRERQAVDQAKTAAAALRRKLRLQVDKTLVGGNVQDFHDTSPASWWFSAIGPRAMGGGAAVPIMVCGGILEIRN